MTVIRPLAVHLPKFCTRAFHTPSDTQLKSVDYLVNNAIIEQTVQPTQTTYVLDRKKVFDQRGEMRRSLGLETQGSLRIAVAIFAQALGGERSRKVLATFPINKILIPSSNISPKIIREVYDGACVEVAVQNTPIYAGVLTQANSNIAKIHQQLDEIISQTKLTYYDVKPQFTYSIKHAEDVREHFRGLLNFMHPHMCFIDFRKKMGNDERCTKVLLLGCKMGLLHIEPANSFIKSVEYRDDLVDVEVQKNSLEPSDLIRVVE